MAAKHVSVLEDWMHDSFNYSNNLHRRGQNGVFVCAREVATCLKHNSGTPARRGDESTNPGDG